MTDTPTPTYVPLGELTRDATVSCIDGRHSDCIIGAPGGNMGEFILLLTALEAVSEKALSAREVDTIFDHYLETFGRFYMHTDSHALHWIAEELGRENLTADAIENADADDREVLLPLLTQPSGVGCGHIKAMLSRPEVYHVRTGLIQNALTSYFNHLWRLRDASRLDYVVLEGDHEETELVVFEADDPETLSEETPIPLACKAHDHSSRFVLHDAARRFLLVRSMEFFRTECDLTVERYEEFRAKVDELADIQLEATRQALFPELPTRVIRIRA